MNNTFGEMNNIPKEPGLYQVCYYDERLNREIYGVASVHSETLEASPRGCSVSILWTPAYRTSTSNIIADCLEFGPKIEFPKGGWPSGKNRK